MSIEFRPFHNTDPPKLMRLWNECGLGRGAALGFPCEAFDAVVLAEPYFDKSGLIVACEGADVVGFIHAGFGSNAEGTALSHEAGVISVVLVRPSLRRQGIARRLVARAVDYLRSGGAQEIYAGESAPRNPFYLSLYGWSESVGFLESDVNAAPFFTALGFAAAERRVLFRRDITQRNEPFDPRLVAIRRKVQLAIFDHPPEASWWWMTREGRMDSICFSLIPLTNGDPLARLTCWGMDLHSQTWRQRTVGLMDFYVPERDRRKGYAKALLLEVIRRLRDEMVTHIDVAVRDTDEPALAMVKKLGFEQVDVGVVYLKQ